MIARLHQMGRILATLPPELVCTFMVSVTTWGRPL